LGDFGEARACDFLIRHGFAIIERNYHTTVGEIDIIAEKGGDYYFIEVKTRRNFNLASDEAITFSKRKRLNKTVKIYCYRKNIAGGSIILAGVIIAADAARKKLKFRFCVFS